MVLDLEPPEILAPGTPGVSLGTKIITSKFFSYHKNMMLFNAFFGFVLQKNAENREKWVKISTFPHLKRQWDNFEPFSCFSAFFAKQIQKMHKITSYFYDMRKIVM